jgi:phospholipid transport system substrate-binding protein
MFRKIALALVVATAPALAAPGPGTAAVKTANETINSLLKQKATAGSKEETELAAKVTTSVRSFIDIDELGKRAMVDQWSKLTPAQQKDFLGLLRELIEAQYVKGLRSNLEYAVKYTDESTDKDGNVDVATQIETKRKGRPIMIGIEYVLVKEGGSYRAWDVKTDGVGLVDNYRTMFNKIIAKDGFDGLMTRMRDKKKESTP